jgi:beta-phosphoglucomutase-like phosphatase (HAD superfamily)
MMPTIKLCRKVHGVVFDMDGLLFNTEALYRDATMAAAADGGQDIPLPFYLSTIGTPIEATRMAFNEHCGKEFDFDAFWATANDRFYEMTKLQLCIKAGVVELLDFLDDARLPRAIATSSRHEDAQHNLTTLGLVDRFQTVVARGDYSRGKPHPDPFLKAAERLGIAPELCVALEDSHQGVRSASRAGMMTIMVPDLLPPTSEMEELCICIVQDLHEVCSLMRSQRPSQDAG